MSPEELVTSIVRRVQERLPDIVLAGAARTWDQVPAYAASSDPALRDDLALHIDAVFQTVLGTILKDRAAERADFPVTAAQARRRFEQGVSLSDFLRAFRINQVVLWESVLEAAGRDPSSRDAALHLATHVMQVIEVGSSVAADAYVQAQQLEVAEGDRLARDLMEDLLAGRVPDSGPKRGLAHASGLEPPGDLLVVAATPARPLPGEQSLRDALSMIRGVIGAGRPGLAVIRQDEIVGIAVAGGAAPSKIIADLERVHRRLARQTIQLTLGVSTVHDGPTGVPDAYTEAVTARDGLLGEPGILALPTISTFQYLMLRDDPTARRVIRPELRRFVEDDQAGGGTLIATLEEYLRSDLNAKTAAANLHVHVNTAYYRLDRIAERTGCDLRRFADLLELLIAIRLIVRQPGSLTSGRVVGTADQGRSSASSEV